MSTETMLSEMEVSTYQEHEVEYDQVGLCAAQSHSTSGTLAPGRTHPTRLDHVTRRPACQHDGSTALPTSQPNIRAPAHH